MTKAAAEKPEETLPKTLYQKLVEVMTEIGRVEKRGYNDFHKYAYVMESDLMEAVRQRLADRNVLLIPAVESVQHDDTLTTAVMRFTFVDAESGEKHEVQWAGTGDDKGDKGLYKAFTGAEKYFLMKMFLISTGDDPEGDTRTDKRADNKPDAGALNCPECGKSKAVIKGKEEYGGGWLCFKKKGGCGYAWQTDAPDGEPTAEVTALREKIKEAMTALNAAGDTPLWTVERVNAMVRENFNGKITARLTAPELGDLAQMFSQRLEAIRGKMGTEAADLIAAIKSAETDAGIMAYLKEHHAGAALESLNIEELGAMDRAVSIPF